MTFFTTHAEVPLDRLAIGPRRNTGARSVATVSLTDARMEPIRWCLPTLRVLWEPAVPPGAAPAERVNLRLSPTPELQEWYARFDEAILHLAAAQSVQLWGRQRGTTELEETYVGLLRLSPNGNYLQTKVTTNGNHRTQIWAGPGQEAPWPTEWTNHLCQTLQALSSIWFLNDRWGCTVSTVAAELLPLPAQSVNTYPFSGAPSVETQEMEE